MTSCHYESGCAPMTRRYRVTVLTSLTLCLTSGAFDGGAGGCPLLSFVGGDAFGQSIAVDAENSGSFRQVLSMLGQRLLNIELFKFGECFVQKDLAFQHLLHEVF